MTLRSRNTAAAIAALIALRASAFAQMPGMPGMSHDAHNETSTALSAKARKQIDSVAKAVHGLATTTSAASSAGFRPVFGWIPTMGVHWVAGGQMMNGRQANVNMPSQLMFSKINGRDSLVGAAYAYFTATADTVRPTIFDGAPPWHERKDLGPPGGTLVMLHVWFVASPKGHSPEPIRTSHSGRSASRRRIRLACATPRSRHACIARASPCRK